MCLCRLSFDTFILTLLTISSVWSFVYYFIQLTDLQLYGYSEGLLASSGFFPGYVYVGGTGVVWLNFIWWRFEVQNILVVWQCADFFSYTFVPWSGLLGELIRGRERPRAGVVPLSLQGSDEKIRGCHQYLPFSDNFSWVTNLQLRCKSNCGSKRTQSKSVLVYGVYINIMKPLNVTKLMKSLC